MSISTIARKLWLPIVLAACVAGLPRLASALEVNAWSLAYGRVAMGESAAMPLSSVGAAAIGCATARVRAGAGIAVGDYGDALAVLQSARNDCPSDPLTQHWLGRAYALAGEWDEAVLHLREVGAGIQLQELGDQLAEDELWGEALMAYAAALNLRPSDCANHVRAGNAAWRAQENLVESLAHFTRATELCPRESWGYVSAARVLVDAGEYAEGERWAMLAEDIAPTSEVPLNILGLSRLRQNRPDEAVSYLQAALETNPVSSEAHALLGSAYLGLGRFAEAASELERAMAIGPGEAWVFEALGMAYEGMGRTSEAIDAYEKALEIDPARQSTIDSLRRIIDGT